MSMRKRMRATTKSCAGEFTALRIGKNGVTGEFIAEAKEQIENGGGVKIKMPRGLSPQEKDNMAEDLARQTDSIMVDRRGNIATLRKK